MNLTRFAIEKKRITTALLLIIIFSGLSTYFSMSRDEDPGFIIRTAQIITRFPGASPSRVENLITDKLEEAIREMPEIDNITSQSKPGVSIIIVNIKESYREMRPIWDSMRRKVDKVRGSLPEGIVGPDVNDEFGDVFGTLIAITGEGFSYAELLEIAEDVRNEMLLIDEVAKVEIEGEQDERIFIEFNNARLAEARISPGQLQQILTQRNIIFPGGEVYTRDEQIALEPSGNFNSIDELRRTIVRIPGSNQIVYLGDLARVDRGYIDPPRSKISYNGQPALCLALSLREGGNVIQLGERVREKLARFQSIYPIGLEFDVLYFQPYFVDRKITEFTSSLIQAISIVMLVMLFTLGVRTGLVVASLIPMAMVAALMVMGFFGIGLDQMSLSALIIALGMLVDNAIVMSESIMVEMGEGKSALQAALDSASELRIPLLTSSLTTAAAFLPIYLAESTTGEYTGSIFTVVTITLLCSWLLSLTMTPLFCVLFLRVKSRTTEEGFTSRTYQNYRKMLLAGLRHPILSIIGVLILFFGAMSLFPYVPQIFFPSSDKPVMYAEIKLPVGTPLHKTEAVASELEAFIKSRLRADAAVGRAGIIDFTSFIGAGAPRYQLSYGPVPPSPEYAYILINTTSQEEMTNRLIPELRQFCETQFPDLNAKISPLDLGPPVTAPVEIRISGKESDKIFEIADRVRERLASISGTRNIQDDWGPRAKKLIVRISQPRAQRAGLTSQDIALSLQTVLSGVTSTSFREDDEVIPVVLRSVSADRRDIGKLESHNIYVSQTGRAVPLKQVADIEVVFQPAKILRRDGQKTVTISAQTASGANAMAIAAEMDTWLASEAQSWPVGYLYEHGGELESSGKAQDSIGEKLPIAGLLIVLLLVSQFDSFRKPVIILLTIPVGLIGVIAGLFLTQTPFGFMAMLGVISLAGIVINNAIVLIDRIKIEIELGLEPAQAIVVAAQRRLRPILLTTATTVGGLLPLVFGGGPLFTPMAIAILSGLLFATVITLGIVPVLYRLFFRVSYTGYSYSGAGES